MSEPLTILHLVSLRGMGGRAATALRQIRLLSARGHRVLVGCLPGSSVEQRSRQSQAQVFTEFHFRRGLRPLAFWQDCRRVAALCNQYQVDVLHTHLSQETWVGCVGARLARSKPALVRSRGVVVPTRPHVFNRLLHNRFSELVIVPSDVIFRHVSALPGFDPGRVRLVPEGVNLQRFAPTAAGAEIRREFGVALDAPLIVMVARLERVKGHEVFFKALAEVVGAGKVPALRALCACDERSPGAFEAAVRQARAWGLSEEFLKFTGMRSDVEKIIAAASVVALPSLGSEGSSRVGLEAAGCGVPVVASAVGCLPEVIEQGRTGLLVPPGDPAALAAALLELATDPAKCREFGRAARRRAEERYDENLMIERLEAAYRSVTGRRGAGAVEGAAP